MHWNKIHRSYFIKTHVTPFQGAFRAEHSIWFTDRDRGPTLHPFPACAGLPPQSLGTPRKHSSPGINETGMWVTALLSPGLDMWQCPDQSEFSIFLGIINWPRNVHMTNFDLWEKISLLFRSKWERWVLFLWLPVQIQASQSPSGGEADDIQAPALTEEPQAVHSCCGREGLSFLRVWPPVGFLCSSGRSHPHAYMGIANWANCIIQEKTQS